MSISLDPGQMLLSLINAGEKVVNLVKEYKERLDSIPDTAKDHYESAAVLQIWTVWATGESPKPIMLNNGEELAIKETPPSKAIIDEHMAGIVYKNLEKAMNDISTYSLTKAKHQASERFSDLKDTVTLTNHNIRSACSSIRAAWNTVSLLLTADLHDANEAARVDNFNMIPEV